MYQGGNYYQDCGMYQAGTYHERNGQFEEGPHHRPQHQNTPKEGDTGSINWYDDPHYKNLTVLPEVYPQEYFTTEYLERMKKEKEENKENDDFQ